MKNNKDLKQRIHDFTLNLLRWDQIDSSRQLPWVFETDPYRIWVSEVMLQQTRAQTVIPYYHRFIQKLPDIQSLANASVDQVLSLWSGLGYYARARNLHRAAKMIQQEHNGILPTNFKDIHALPGIGKSTAGAICALAYGLRTPILDGNASRVYCRFHCIDDLSDSARKRKLWQLADLHTPRHECKKYTQSIMDLGATICLPKNPTCNLCPVNSMCCARRKKLVKVLPLKNRKIVRNSKTISMLIILNANGEVLLERRPEQGIWGGLWSFPEYSGQLNELAAWLENNFSFRVISLDSWSPIRHALTHFTMVITPILINVRQLNKNLEDQNHGRFFTIDEALGLGLPAPVSTLLGKIRGLTK